jgi:bifunctional DNA-binding transcriptional regulator/antitoxin component of YhaV-PrlF toxin-antitoxin module
MRKAKQHIVRKLRDVRVNSVLKRRVDVTLPPEILEKALVRAGDSVEIRVTVDRRIVLMPLRTSWPTPCRGREVGCMLAERHDGACVVEAPV